MYKRMPCVRCGRPKPPGLGRRVCELCSPIDAIWPRLEIGPGGCWIWTGDHVCDGYGRWGSELVHRMVYQFLIVDIPEDLDLDHLCLVKLCANPWHLEPVTRGENSRRKWAIYTHCRNGHEFTEQNTYVDPSDGTRSCRICTASAQRRYLARKRRQVTG
jgi:hypothetical protein